MTVSEATAYYECMDNLHATTVTLTGAELATIALLGFDTTADFVRGMLQLVGELLDD